MTDTTPAFANRLGALLPSETVNLGRAPNAYRVRAIVDFLAGSNRWNYLVRRDHKTGNVTVQRIWGQ